MKRFWRVLQTATDSKQYLSRKRTFTIRVSSLKVRETWIALWWIIANECLIILENSHPKKLSEIAAGQAKLSLGGIENKASSTPKFNKILEHRGSSDLDLNDTFEQISKFLK